MSELKLEFIGKQVKDIYGTSLGTVIGILTDAGSSIESFSVDCGDAGLKQLSYEQLIIQGDYAICIPKWRLDAQKLFLQKNLTHQRIKALQHLVEEDVTMKEHAEIVYIKYERNLKELEEKEKSINEILKQRLEEVNRSTRNIESILFDVKLQYQTNEMTKETYFQIKKYCKEFMDRINLEKEEINTIKDRIEEQNLENMIPLPPPIQKEEEEEENGKTIEITSTPTISSTTNTNTDKGNIPNTNNKSNSNTNSNKVSHTSNDIDSEENWIEQVIGS